MTRLAAAALILCSSSAFAKNWYVSTGANASDAYTGTTAGDVNHPFKTLGKLLTLGKLPSGDTINLACGSEWREQLNLTSANSAGNLAIRSYPADCAAASTANPVITGGVLLSNITWQAVSGKNYYVYQLTTAEAAALTNAPEFILKPGNPSQKFFKARYPNPAATGNNYALATGVDTSGTSTDPVSGAFINGRLLAGSAQAQDIAVNDVNGADVHMRNEQWYVSSSKVNGYSNGALTIAGLPATMTAGDGYVLENKLWMLDAPGEWFYDQATKKLYAINTATSGGVPPTQLELTVRDSGITVKGIPGIQITGVDVRATIKQAIDIRDSANASVTKTTLNYASVGAGGSCGDNAALFIGPSYNISCQPTASSTAYTNATANQNNIGFSGHSGLNVISDQAQLNNNTVYGNGVQARTRNVAGAFQVSSAGGVVTGNSVFNSAYMGITFSNKSKVINNVEKSETISGNVVGAFCVYYADCGGIYTYNGNGALDQPTPLAQGKAQVINNIVYDGIGDYQGNHRTERNLTVGVYLDAYTKAVKVDNNVIMRVGTGLYLHGAADNTLSNNLVHAATGQGLLASDGLGGGNKMTGNKVQGNIFHTYRRYVFSSASQLPQYQDGVAQNWYHKTNPSLLFTTLGNTVSGNVAVDAGGKPAQWRLRTDAYPFTQDHSLGYWSQFAPTDVIKAPFTPKLTNVSGVNLLNNGDFSNGLTDWSAPSGTTVASGAGCVGSCAQFSPTAANTWLQSSTFQMSTTPGSLYYFEFSGRGASGSQAFGRIYDASTYAENGYHSDVDLSHDLGGAAGAAEQRWIERFFVPESGAISRVGFLNNVNKPVNLDQVKVFKVPATFAAANLYDPTQYTSLIHNTGASASYQCPFTTGCAGAVNHEGMPLTFPLTVGTGGKVLVFATPTAWAR